MIMFTKQGYTEIIDHCLKAIPNEACGIIAGTSEGDEATVKKVYLLTNTDNSPEHFSMDPKEQFAAVKDMRSKGLKMLGNFHSHPQSPARPSEEDKRLAFDPDMSYLILSLMETENPVLKSFKITKEEVVEEGIRII